MNSVNCLESFKDYLIASVQEILQIDKDIQNIVAQYPREEALPLVGWRKRIYILNNYCNYILQHKTDHGLAQALGHDMEQLLTIQAMEMAYPMTDI